MRVGRSTYSPKRSAHGHQMAPYVLAAGYHPVHFDARFPNSNDVANRQHIGCGIAADEEEISAAAWENPSSITQTKSVRGAGRRCRENLGRTQSGFAEHFDLMVHADSMSGSVAATSV